MAYQQIAGVSMRFLPWEPQIALSPTITTHLLIDATGEKIAFVGRFFHKSRGSKDISRVGFRFGAITKAGGSALTVSLQDVALGTGPVMVPDETQDQTVAIANGDASFASNTWYRTGTLSANRTLAFGELVAVVIEYDGGGRLGSDSVVLSCLSATANHTNQAVLKTGGTWASVASLPNVVLECSDGSFGTLVGAMPFSATSSLALNTGTTPDEVALKIALPFSYKSDGGTIALRATGGASADFDLVFYDGTSAIGTARSLDANVLQSTNERFFEIPTVDEKEITTSMTPRMAVKPTTANSQTIYYIDVADAGHLDCYPGGSAWCWSQRTDAGAWSDTTTRRPLFGPSISSIDVPAGGAGGGPLIGGRLIR